MLGKAGETMARALQTLQIITCLCVAAAAALDIALVAGLCKKEPAGAGAVHARAVYALLSGLIRRFT